MKIKYIGKKITYGLIRKFILDEKHRENDEILLNSKNFDDIVLNYPEFYNESMIFPHLLLSVSISQARRGQVPIDKIGVIKK